MDNICRFVPYHKDYHSIHTINFVLETTPQKDTSLISQAVYKMYCVKSGSGFLHTVSGKHPVSEGDIFFTFPGMPFAIESDKNFSFMYISFLGTRGNMIMEKLKISDRNFIVKGFSHILSFWDRGLSANTELSDLMSESVLLYTFTEIGNRTLVEEDKKQGGNIALVIKKYVDDNFSSPDFSLDNMSRELSYNKKYISSVFKKTIGIGLSEYLNTIRIQHACTLMDKGFTSVYDVSLLSGFSDSGYFSKVFKQKMSISPAMYIKSVKG